jgi:hypothetical protein
MIAYLAPMIFSTTVFDQIILNYQKTKSTKMQTVVNIQHNCGICRHKQDWLYLILFRSYIVSCSRSYVVSCSRSHIVSCLRLYMVFYARLYIVSCLRLYIVSYSNHKWYLVLDRTWYLAQYGMLHHVQDCTFYHV